MKKFELYLAIAMIIITTIIDVMFPFIVPYSASNLALMCLLSAMGYVGAYLLLDSFLSRHEMHHYFKGYDAGRGLYESSPKRKHKPFYDEIY